MKISLAIIAGNVEHWMPRFLDSFSPLFDQIIVVRAIGNQSPDASLDIARSRGCITAEYHNKPAHAEWPHVDDFAAARNLAFKLADGDYIAWADTDDVYGGTLEEWQALRKRIATERPDVVTLPYVVPEDQLCVLRERILRRDTGTWISPIHESFKVNIEAPRVIVQESPVWHHATHKDRTPNNERNLRILESIPESERTISHLFHLWQSMRFVGRIEEGVKIAQQALKHPDLGPDEGYELLINIAQVSTNVLAQEQYLLHALNAALSPRGLWRDGELQAAPRRSPRRPRVCRGHGRTQRSAGIHLEPPRQILRLPGRAAPRHGPSCQWSLQGS
jgi:hypothetical protein